LEQVLDKIGNPIYVGSFIIYGHNIGRCAGLKIGKVLEIKMQRHHLWTADIDDDITPHLRVMSVDDDWKHEEPHLMKAKGTLSYPDSRVVVIPAEMVPESYRKLLENV
jgi:hypothetical protein